MQRRPAVSPPAPAPSIPPLHADPLRSPDVSFGAPSESAGVPAGSSNTPSPDPAGSDWSTAVGQYAASLDRQQITVDGVRAALAKMPDNSAAMRELIASQARLSEDISASVATQTSISTGIAAVQT